MSQRDGTPDNLVDSTPYGSLKPNIVTTVITDVGEQLTIPYGSLKPNAPAPHPVAQTQPAPQPQGPEQPVLPAPPSTEN